MNSASANTRLCRLLGILGAFALVSLAASDPLAAEQAAANKAAPAVAAQGAESFATPQQAADALIEAAEKFDVGALVEDFRPRRRGNRPHGRVSAGPPARSGLCCTGAGEEKRCDGPQEQEPCISPRR